MDWSKAKNILIIALIATNIFLLFTYYSRNESDDSITEQEVLFALLEEKNISVETKIPDKYDRMPAINIEYTNDNQQLIEKNLKSGIYNVPTDSKKDVYKKATNKFLKDCQIDRENLMFDRIVTEGNVVKIKYNNCYNKIVIGDSFVEVCYVEGKIQDITRQFLKATPHSKKKLKVISPEEALLMFMSEQDSKQVIHVENIQLVFWVNDSSLDGRVVLSDTLFPAWKITYNDGMIKYIIAYKA